MKKFVIMAFALILISSCGPNMYSTRSSGSDNSAFIIVLNSGAEFANLVVDVDGELFSVEKVYKEKDARKAPVIEIEPGEHIIKVTSNGEELVSERVYLGLRETKKIVLK